MGGLVNRNEETNLKRAKYPTIITAVYPKYDKKICYYQ